MALISMSIDEISTMLGDAYDTLALPRKIWRNVNNKFWLVFRAIAAGYQVIIDAALALHNRFDPAQCDDTDLYSTAKIVGTAFKEGSGSLLQITIVNTSATLTKTLVAGIYTYTSPLGEAFSFELVSDIPFEPTASATFTAISADKGSFHVAAQSSVNLSRSDNAAIDPAFSFSVADNASQQGYLDESPWSFRQRILTDPNRQDAVAEIELAIRNLPNIFECNVVFNATPDTVTYDGIDIEPYQMLVVITGAPTDEIATAIATRTVYNTVNVDDDQVVYYYNTQYIDGKYAVYFAYHQQTDFQLEVKFQYDSQKIHAEVAQQQLDDLLNIYRGAVQHVDVITEDDIYTQLKSVTTVSVKVLNVNIKISGVGQDYLSIPKSRLPNLTAVTWSNVDLSA